MSGLAWSGSPRSVSLGAFLFSVSGVNKPKTRADERTRTADLISLRVIHQALQRFAQGCKSRIFRGVSFLRLARCCTVLRSRWYQSGIKRLPGLRIEWCR